MQTLSVFTIIGLISKFYKPNQLTESSSYTTDSTESSFSSATSTTSTGTVVCNYALKPKNNQTHSVSQTSLTTSTSAAALAKQSSSSLDKSNQCHLLQCSYANLTPTSSQKDQPTSTSSVNHGTIMIFEIKALPLMSCFTDETTDQLSRRWSNSQLNFCCFQNCICST